MGIVKNKVISLTFYPLQTLMFANNTFECQKLCILLFRRLSHFTKRSSQFEDCSSGISPFFSDLMITRVIVSFERLLHSESRLKVCF